MFTLRRLGAAVMVLAMAGAVLAGPASAANEGRTRARSSSAANAGNQARASFNLGSVDAATRSRMQSALSRNRTLRSANVSAQVTGNVLELAGTLTPAILDMVKKLLSAFGIDLANLPLGIGAGAGGTGAQVGGSAGTGGVGVGGSFVGGILGSVLGLVRGVLSILPDLLHF